MIVIMSSCCLSRAAPTPGPASRGLCYPSMASKQQDVQAALRQHLQLLRHQWVEVDALDLQFLYLDELDLDGAAVVALRLAHHLDAHLAGPTGVDARVVAEHALGGADAVEMR